MAEQTTKTCPRCDQEIKARALVCYHCGAGFDVIERGYCGHCHAVVEARDGRCAACGGELVDVNVESRLRAGVVQSSSSPAAVPPPAASGSRSTGQRLAWAFAILLLLAGLGGFGVAAAIDNSNEETFGADYRALGERDAGTEAKTLNASVTRVKGAYDAYVAAQRVVFSAHEAVTDHFNQVVSPDDPLLFAANINARQEIPQVIAGYGAAVEQGRAAREAYVHQLALLNVEVGR